MARSTVARLGLWAGLTLLLGLAGWLMLSACGLAWPGAGRPWLAFCPAPQAADQRDAVLEAERARQRLLEQRLDRLRLALVQAPDCPQPEPPPQIAERPRGPPPETVEAAPPPDIPPPQRRPTPPPRPPEPEPPPPPEPEPAPQPPPPPAPAPQDEFDRRVEREGGRRGEVQITLLWDNGNDLDLHVHCPDGSHIWYAGMWGCGGQLDVDANAGGPQTNAPVENVTWPGGAPSGPYRIAIDHFANHGGPEPTPYRVRVRIGEEVQIYEGALAPGQPDRVIQIFVP